MDGYKHYIRTNESGIVIHGFSAAFEQPQKDDMLVTEDGPRHFHQAWPGGLTNERGQYRFKLSGNKIVERPQTELDAEPVPPVPVSPEQRAAKHSARLLLELAKRDITIKDMKKQSATTALILAKNNIK